MRNRGRFMARMKGVWICLQNDMECPACWPFLDCYGFLILILLEGKVILSANYCLEDTEGLKIKSWEQKKMYDSLFPGQLNLSAEVESLMKREEDINLHVKPEHISSHL